MKAKNEKERNKSFLKFVSLFVITTLLVVGAVFLNYRVPHKENELLRKRAAEVEQQEKFQREFAGAIKEASNYLDSLEVEGVNHSYINDLISQKLVQIQRDIPTNDSTFRYNMYKNILDLLVDQQKKTKELNELADAETQIEELEQEIDELVEELDQAKRDLDIYRVSRRR